MGDSVFVVARWRAIHDQLHYVEAGLRVYVGWIWSGGCAAVPKIPMISRICISLDLAGEIHIRGYTTCLRMRECRRGFSIDLYFLFECICAGAVADDQCDTLV